MSKVNGGTGDPLVVSAVELAHILRRWIQDHEEGLPIRGNDDAYDVTRMGGIEYLAHWADTGPRAVRRILRGEVKWVTYDLAERLLIAADMPHKLTILTVVANPMWGAEKWHRYMAERGCEPE